MPTPGGHEFPLDEINAAFDARQAVVQAMDAMYAAESAVEAALNLPSAQLYQYELAKGDQFLIRPSAVIPGRIARTHFGQLALGPEILMPISAPAGYRADYLRLFPLVPVDNKLKKQANPGISIVLGMSAFQTGRLSVVTRSDALQRVAEGRVFNPYDLKSS